MINPATADLHVLPDPERLARRVADWLTQIAAAKSGPIAISLSGGSTPRRIYQLLAEPPCREQVPWSRVHLFWGDERFVPADDPASNFRMVREALLSRVPIPAANIHAVPIEGSSPQAAAVAYERGLASFYGAPRLDSARPLFDVTLLGLGTDGHTASLFPGSKALEFRDRWVVPAIDGNGDARITLTYPAIESSRYVAFVAAGTDKRDVLARLRRGEDMPATRLRPVGDLCWFVDEAAAGARLI